MEKIKANHFFSRSVAVNALALLTQHEKFEHDRMIL